MILRPHPDLEKIIHEDDEKPSRPWIWIGALALALALHWGIGEIQLPWDWKKRTLTPIQTIDPAKLDAIRKQWNKNILISKDKSKNSTPAPDHAKYFSERNIRVDRESRARSGDILPKPGTPQPSTPSLKNLGVPLDLSVPSRVRIAPPRPTHAGPSGVDQWIDDPTLPQGAANLLNAQESVYYSFYARMYERAGPLWKSKISQIPYRRGITPGEYVTQVDVVYDSSGQLIDVRLLKSSGISEFDLAVIQTWRQLGKMPNPPKDLLDTQGEVHTGWSFHVHLGPGFRETMPPSQDY
jgi:TonB family protein